MPIRVLAISGSLRRDSHNTKLLLSAATLLPPGSQLTLWDSLKGIPPFDEDDEGGPPHPVVASLRQAVLRADAMLIATPEYNHSVPGQLKNALDWLSRPLAGNPMQRKAAAVVGASTGIYGAVWAQAETRRILEALGARVLDRELPVPAAAQQFDADGQLLDGEVESQMRELLGELVAGARPNRAQVA
ncbi:MAG: NAD(P)H-dependent oxidoreductase [Actinobacteria bacterium]|nr:NAD(P)H-dependent oxidoreductase [Actinomycetota bacterium]